MSTTFGKVVNYCYNYSENWGTQKWSNPWANSNTVHPANYKNISGYSAFYVTSGDEGQISGSQEIIAGATSNPVTITASNLKTDFWIRLKINGAKEGSTINNLQIKLPIYKKVSSGVKYTGKLYYYGFIAKNQMEYFGLNINDDLSKVTGPRALSNLLTFYGKDEQILSMAESDPIYPQEDKTDIITLTFKDDFIMPRNELIDINIKANSLTTIGYNYYKNYNAWDIAEVNISSDYTYTYSAEKAYSYPSKDDITNGNGKSEISESVKYDSGTTPSLKSIPLNCFNNLKDQFIGWYDKINQTFYLLDDTEIELPTEDITLYPCYGEVIDYDELDQNTHVSIIKGYKENAIQITNIEHDLFTYFTLSPGVYGKFNQLIPTNGYTLAPEETNNKIFVKDKNISKNISLYANYRQLKNNTNGANQYWYYGDEKLLSANLYKTLNLKLTDGTVKEPSTTSLTTQGFFFTNDNKKLIFNKAVTSKFKFSELFDKSYGYQYSDNIIDIDTFYVIQSCSAKFDSSNFPRLKILQFGLKTESFVNSEYKTYFSITNYSIDYANYTIKLEGQIIESSDNLIDIQLALNESLFLMVDNNKIDYDYNNNVFKFKDKYPTLSTSSPLHLTFIKNGAFTQFYITNNEDFKLNLSGLQLYTISNNNKVYYYTGPNERIQLTDT